MTDKIKRDEIFRSGIHTSGSFEFNQDVARVFDDMVERSIPFYHEIHRMIIDLCTRLPMLREVEELVILDIGCSTGTTIQILATLLDQLKINYRFVGIDQSNAMLEVAREKMPQKLSEKVELKCDCIQAVELPKAHFVVMNYTLQFIKVSERKDILKKINQCLNPGGFFVLSEKIHTDDPIFEEMFVELYYDFKRGNGYSELEIAQKREALENVLIPLTSRQLIELMASSGFSNAEMLFRWYNFASFLGIKGHDESRLSEKSNTEKWVH